jgi:hypothetical protein
MAYTTIDNPELYFQTKIYTGDGSTPSITLDGDTDMQPDLVWIKNRDQTDSHCLFDAVRGATKLLSSDNYNAETTDADTLTSFDSDGFALGADVKVNTNTEAYVAWCWKANGTGSANIEGNTDTTISANTTAGFSIIDGCDDLNDDDTFGHGLNSAPDMVFLKRRDDISGWRVFYTGITDGSTLFLNSSAAVGDDSATVGPVSSTLITVEGSGTGGYEGDNENVAYAWHSVQGFSKFGSYTGNGDANGTFVYTGFRPAMIIVKVTDTVGDWRIFDTTRDTYNVADAIIYPSVTNAEGTETFADFLSNGFKTRSSSAAYNGDGNAYIYMAFAESPFVTSGGVPCTAR